MGTAGTGIIERWRSQAWPRVAAWWPAAVAVRLVVAVVLIAGPATDEVSDLAGWDAERFQEIAEREAPAWVGQPVEYPPGSVVVFDRLAGVDVVQTHQRLVGLSVLLDLGVALALARRLGGGSATAYLWLGLPLVPFGYQRLDTLVTAIAVVGALALLGQPGRPDRRAGPLADVVVALAVAIGALVKLWPILLVVGAIAIGRRRAALGALALTALGGGIWLATTGSGLEPVDQVLSLRGATGWHVESLPGALVALFGSGPAGLELNAYRIGTLQPALVTAGRALAVVAMGALALLGWRRSREVPVGSTGEERTVLALATLGAVSALLVTAPLLSPQFVVWLTPWAAMVVAERTVPATARAVAATAVAATLTGLSVHGFGPANLTSTVPAALLTIRNLALLGLVAICLAALRAGGPPAAPQAGPAQAGPREATPAEGGEANINTNADPHPLAPE